MHTLLLSDDDILEIREIADVLRSNFPINALWLVELADRAAAS